MSLEQDIYNLAIYKIACWNKVAEEETPLDDYPRIRRDLTPAQNAEAIDFDYAVASPMTEPDKDFPQRSVVDGRSIGIPRRYAETAVQMGGGVNLPSPYPNPKSKTVTQSAEQRFGPENESFNLIHKPYSMGFAKDILENRDFNRYRKANYSFSDRPNSSKNYDMFPDINDAIRYQHNFR